MDRRRDRITTSKTALAHLRRAVKMCSFLATVCKMVHPMLLDSCLSCRVCLSVCLSVCDVGVLWRNGWMDQDATCRPLTWPPCVLWGPSSHQNGHSPPIFGPCLLWSNSLIDQDAIPPLGRELGIGLCHILLDGDPAPPKRGTAALPLFGPCLLWPNGWIDQDTTWYGGRPWSRPHCQMGTQLSPKGGTAALPIFGQCLLWPNC